MTRERGRSEIQLGDLALALKKLAWQDDEQAKLIARCLGFGWTAARPNLPTPEIYDRQRYPKTEPPRPNEPVRPPIAVPPAPPSPVTLPEFTATSQLEPLSERAPADADVPDWLDASNGAAADAETQPAVARRSLMHERTHRHILSAALGMRRKGGEIDLMQLIDRVCRREVIADLPRLPEATLDLGCDLLLDYSATMVPYWDDLTLLAEQVQQVVGAAVTRTYSFDGQPDQAMRWTADGDRLLWVPDGRPVLVATDFGLQGLTGRASASPSWLELVQRCARFPSPLIILVIWPEPRWPTNLGRTPVLVHWSPHTTAAMLRKRIGAGHTVG